MGELLAGSNMLLFFRRGAGLDLSQIILYTILKNIDSPFGALSDLCCVRRGSLLKRTLVIGLPVNMKTCIINKPSQLM